MPATTKMQLALYLVLLIKCSFGRANIDYNCPRPYCRCATLPDRLDAVQLVCRPPIIHEAYFNVSSVPANYTAWLTIQCTVSLIHSQLTDGAFSHLKDLEELLIQDCVIPTIPKNAFLGLKSLTHLNISRQDESYISTIPEPGFLDPLTNLKVLNIPRTKIQNFPEGFLCPLHKLKYIELSINDKSSINGLKCNVASGEDPPLPKVTFLNLNTNGFGNADINFHKVMPNVQVLGLASNKLTEISKETFQGLPQLQSLYLENNPIAEIASNTFQELSSLQVLSLENTQLTWLDGDTFKYNSNLWLLLLSYNFLDDQTFRGKGGGILRYTPYLHLLDLSFNNISNISKFFANTPYLMQLDLGNNAIAEVPNQLFGKVAMLQTLNLTHNPLHTDGLVSDSFSGLQQLNILDLSECKLSTIPENLFQETTSLTQLYMAYNKLTHLPESLKTLQLLQLLDLSWNRIVIIQRQDFSQMSSLAFLKMNHNEIQYIPKALLKANPNVQEVCMEGNQIEEIEYGAFEGLNNLRILDLSSNKITDISIVFYQLTKLAYIFLANNKITSINKWCFPPTTKIVFLQNNLLGSIERGTFTDLHQLQVVRLQNNQLRKVSPVQLQMSPQFFYRPQFFLRGNPIICDCQMSWILGINDDKQIQRMPYVTDLKSLQCDSKYHRNAPRMTTIDSDDYLCEWSPVKCLEFSCDCCWEELCSCRYTCPPKCSCYNNGDGSLDIVDCSNRNLTAVPQIPSIATEVHLDGNNFQQVPSLSFQSNSRIKILSLNKSNIEVIQDEAFQGLTALRSLWLDNNNIRNISTATFSGLQNVKNISLHRNAIETLYTDTFDNTKTLINLTLHDNNLAEIDVEKFLRKNSNLTSLTLSHNPWSCNCSFVLGFQEWIRTNILIVKDANYIQCQDDGVDYEIISTSTEIMTPYTITENLNNSSHVVENGIKTWTQLLHASFTHCYPNNSMIINKPFENRKAIIALSVSGCLFLLMFTIALIIYSSREIIKVWLYNRYGFRFNKENERNDGKKFDAFVSYSQKDQKFVTKSLVPKLEQVKPYYHLCLHYRDWPVGGSIAQTICESVEKSRRTIILLSENFIKSEWCQYEFKAAHYRVLHDKTIRLIVILLDDKPPANLDPELKLYIKTNTYLEWKDPWFWEKLKYALPDVDREPRPSGYAYYKYMAGKTVNSNPDSEQANEHEGSISGNGSDITDTDENADEEATDDNASGSEVEENSENVTETTEDNVSLNDTLELAELTNRQNGATKC